MSNVTIVGVAGGSCSGKPPKQILENFAMEPVR